MADGALRLVDTVLERYERERRTANISRVAIVSSLNRHGVHTVEAMTDAQRAAYLSKYLERFIGPGAAHYTSSVYHDFTRDAYIGGGFSAGGHPS